MSSVCIPVKVVKRGPDYLGGLGGPRPGLPGVDISASILNSHERIALHNITDTGDNAVFAETIIIFQGLGFQLLDEE